MPLRILKLAITAEIDVTTNPDVARFFHVVETQVTEGTYTIEVDEFEDDAGDPPAELPALAADNSYYRVYINGVLQMEGITAYIPGGVGTGQLQITVAEDETIEEGAPIVLEVTNFDPDSTVDLVT